MQAGQKDTRWLPPRCKAELAMVLRCGNAILLPLSPGWGGVGVRVIMGTACFVCALS
jgi:hypothetical protein